MSLSPQESSGGAPVSRSHAFPQIPASSDEVMALKKRLEESRAEVRSSLKQNQALIVQNQAFIVQNQALSMETTDLKLRIQDLLEASEYRGDATGTASAVDTDQTLQYQKQISDLEVRIGKHERNKAKLLEHITKLESRIEELNTEEFLEQLAKRTDEKLIADNEQLKTKTEELQGLVRRKDNTIAALEQQLASHKDDEQKMDRLTRNLRSSEERLQATKLLLETEVMISKKDSSALRVVQDIVTTLQVNQLARPSAQIIEDFASDDAVKAQVEQLVMEQIGSSEHHSKRGRDANAPATKAAKDRGTVSMAFAPPEQRSYAAIKETKSTGSPSLAVRTRSLSGTKPKLRQQPIARCDEPEIKPKARSANQKAPTTPTKASATGLESEEWTTVPLKVQKDVPQKQKGTALSIGAKSSKVGFDWLEKDVGHPLERVFNNPTKHQVQMTSSADASVVSGTESSTEPEKKSNPQPLKLTPALPGPKTLANVVQTRKLNYEDIFAQGDEPAPPAAKVEVKPEPSITLHKHQQPRVEDQASSSKPGSSKGQRSKDGPASSEPASETKLPKDKSVPSQPGTSSAKTQGDKASIAKPKPETQVKAREDKPAATDFQEQSQTKATDDVTSMIQSKEIGVAKHEAGSLNLDAQSTSAATPGQSTTPSMQTETSTLATTNPALEDKKREHSLDKGDESPNDAEPSTTSIPAAPQPLVQDKSKGKAFVGPDGSPPKHAREAETIASQQGADTASDPSAQQSTSRYSANVPFPTKVLVSKGKGDEGLPTVKGDPYSDNNWRDR